MNRGIEFIDAVTTKTIGISEKQVFSRLPMIDECILIRNKTYKVTMVLHGKENDHLFVKSMG